MDRFGWHKGEVTAVPARNIWLDGIMGVVVGDALGSPVQFHRRGEVIVNGMERCDTFQTPPGTWTDDSSLTLATAFSIKEKGRIDLDHIAEQFVAWLDKGEFTPFGQAFDVGATCHMAISRYANGYGFEKCGLTDEHSNGNGSLMRILPACLVGSVEEVEKVSALTHAHRRSQIACALYYFIVDGILKTDGTLAQRVGYGLAQGYERYKYEEEFKHFSRLYEDGFAELPESEISSSGYSVHTLEAAVWALFQADNFKDTLLTAVNLGDDADTVGAVCGGLAGLYYGYSSIPDEWLDVIQRRKWIEEEIL